MSQEFGATIDAFEPARPSQKFRKTEFLVLGAGEHRIRILEPAEVKQYTHYVGFSYLACLGDTCPICENNKKILFEHPEDFRDVKGWNPRHARYYINVMDKTPAKVCPKCNKEWIGSTAEACPECGTPLGELKPLMKVKVLSAGKNLIEDLKVQSNSVRNEDDERIDIRMYDWILAVRGAKQEKKISVAHKWYPGKENMEDLGEQQLFDLTNVAVKLSREEMLDVFNGASLKDIFAVRRATKEAEKVVENDIANPLAKASVDEIFKID